MSQAQYFAHQKLVFDAERTFTPEDHFPLGVIGKLYMYMCVHVHVHEFIWKNCQERAKVDS